MDIQCSDVAMGNLNTNLLENTTLSKDLYPKYQEMNRKQHTKQCENVPDILHNNPQDKVPTSRRPRKQERPQKCISGILPCRWDKNEDQTLAIQQPDELHKQMEPIILYICNNHAKGSGTKYVMETATSHLSFQITRPTYIHVRPMPFTIFLKTPRLHTRTDSPGHYTKFIVFHGLDILKQSNAYFYFRPALIYRNIFIEGLVYFHHDIRLRLTTKACCQPLRIPKGTHVGTLHPVQLTK